MIILFTLVSPTDPYEILGVQHAAGMASIESGLASGMAYGDLATLVYNYIQPLYYTTADQFTQNELNSIVPNAINDYINIHLNGYSAQQNYFISVLMNGIFEVPVESLARFFDDVRDNITRAGMSLQAQTPLLIATTIAEANYNYWISAIANSSSPWYTMGYFNTEAYSNLASLPYWIAATIHGTLSGANKAVTYGQIDPPKIVGVDMVSALTASLGLAAGKVMFQFLPRLGSSMNGGGGCGCGG